ncbi:restriction endonuclease subunit S [Limosilactobacillus reuteri]|uniref:restriction endonuclease subunit S n=1 Tax=Limosilactobacillus reuteri TaxID=1598 RepID=UPI002D1FA6B8|nr:restriction endonuclease subunit S [Limosilactobacillus reuteri]MCC4398288.1 restriction endonuclease subunit S [Limosilactobacillus reuteri]
MNKGWEQRKLKDISIIIAGGDKNKDKLKKIGNYPVIANAVNSDGVVGYYDDSYRIEAPAITVTGRGDIGHATPRYLNFTPVVRLLALKTKHNVLFLANAINKITIFNESTGVPQLTKPQLSKYSVKVTKLNEEKKISKIINTLNKLVTLQQRKLRQLKQLKMVMLQQLFVDKNNKKPNLRFKNFKGDWEKQRLEEVAQVTMGQSPSSKNYTDNPNDYVLVQGNADLKSNKISPRVWTKEITKQVHKGEIIMTVRAPVGYLAMANMDAVIGRGVAAIDGNKYLYYLLQTKLMDRTWEKLSSGSTFESISSNDIKNLEIKVTETEEEKLIAKLMDTVTYFVTIQQDNLTQLTTLKKYLLQKLFI